MSVQRFGVLTVALAVAACAAGILIGLAIGRSGVSDLALTASWGGALVLLFAAFTFAGEVTPAFPRLGADRGDPSRYTRGYPFLTSQADIDLAMAENLSRFDRVAGPGLVLACGGLLSVALSLAVHRLA